MSESNIQRATVQFRHRETQLVIFTARERPAQRLFRFNMARKRIRKRQQCQVNTCAAVAGFHDMPEIGNQTVREIDS
ncbi:Uncharacterised protein [Shigella sonnei]|nr:Uncharacterised protein [Shigella sonnei]